MKAMLIPIFVPETGTTELLEKINRSDAEWEALLPPEVFRIARKKDTERPFSGKYHDCKKQGIYVCACCGTALFSSDAKFDSGTGWPSFYAPIAPENIATAEDTDLGFIRTEVLCARCDAHLGHVFEDGPPPTYLRYCMNAASLRLIQRT